MTEQRFVREITESKRRILILSFVVAGIFFLLLLRLWHLQILSADDYRNMSENNRLRFVPVAASRGAILDRNGTVLVSNQPSFSLAVVPQEVTNRDELLDRLAKLLGLDRAEMNDRWEKEKGRARYYPIILASNISRDQVEIVEENHLRLQGVEIEMKPVREYVSGVLASHLLGYIGEISEEELSAKGFEEYNPEIISVRTALSGVGKRNCTVLTAAGSWRWMRVAGSCGLFPSHTQRSATALC